MEAFMTYRSTILMLRISYWTGAILDALWVIPMVFPEIGFSLMGIRHGEVGGELRYALAIGAALMLAWTVLLLWADRRPVERRGVLLITIVPLKVCLDLASLYLPVLGLMTIERFIISKIDAILIYCLFIFSYAASAGLARKTGRVGVDR
jgi:hypothetical protein